MSAPSGGNKYEYPNGVLRNLRNITDAFVLQQIESTAVSLRLLELNAHPLPGSCDLPHLQAIHRYLFQDIYDWAGELRQVDISKGVSRFAHYGFIASNAAKLFAQLAQERYLNNLASDQLATRAAFYLGEINALHPFREGNGRTQRVFFTDLARAAGYTLAWDCLNPQDMIAASSESLLQGDNTRFEQIFRVIMA